MEKYTKVKKNNDLTNLRIKIGDLIMSSNDNGLYSRPYEIYSKEQVEVRDGIINEYKKIIVQLINSLNYQNEVYNQLLVLREKFLLKTQKIKTEDILTLILNTLPELINSNLPRAEILNLCINELISRLKYDKNLFLDIYYIYKITQIGIYRISGIVDEVEEQKFYAPIEKYFEKIDCFRTSKVYYLMKQIAKENNFSKAYDLFYQNLDLLIDVAVIKSYKKQCNGLMPIDLYKAFDFIIDIKEHLYTPIYEGSVGLISGEVTQRVHNMVFSQRHVSFDTNTLSYIRTMHDKGIDRLSENLRGPINDIVKIKQVASYDYSPYIVENYIFTPENKERVIKTIASVEEAFYPNDEYMQNYYRSRIEYSLQMLPAIKGIKDQYYLGYSLLLLMSYINFKFYKQSVIEKINSFCEMMNNMLFIFAEPFIELAYNFFSYGAKYRFFSRIQKNSTNILKSLKNMAWDVYHLWSLEAQCSVIEFGADLLIPYFYCFDKGLLEVKECFDLDAMFICKSTGERICFYHKHSYPIELIESYLDIEKEEERRKKFNKDNIMAMIDWLEFEIENLW